ncbi:MAG: glucosamine-6-phosphate deaminase [Candidatus Marinimicrobia bacterium]|nr:glucosamine-6-phosphate deaminase [Candidatus Neomarinimicrobiota bacterium]
MEIIIKTDYDEMSAEAAAMIADLVYHQPSAVLGLATGSTPLGLYKELIRLHRDEGLDFSKVTTFNLDEYVGLPASHEQSYNFFMWDNLFNHINVNPSNIHIPNGMVTDIEAYCLWYEDEIEAFGGIDLQILGIGSDGHIGFNEPTSSLGSRTRLKTLTKQTIDYNARFFSELTEVPRYAITMGVGTIMEANTCILLANGAGKADMVAKAIEGPVTALVTASALQLHPDAIFILDEEAAASLQLRDYYQWIYENKPE